MADDSVKSSKASDEVKDEGHVATEWEVDVAAQLSAGFDEDISDADAMRIRKKIDWHILPLMCSKFALDFLEPEIGLRPPHQVLYWIQFMDKTTLGSSAILGIRYVCLLWRVW